MTSPEEGDSCPAGCGGKLAVVQGEDCSCHIAPPCRSCVEDGLACGLCDARPEREAA